MSFDQRLPITLAALLDSKVALLTLGTLLAVPVLYTLGSRTDKDIDQVGYVAVSTWRFFKQRSDFLSSMLRQSGKEIVSLNVLHRTVVVTRGTAARKAVVENKNLDFIDGYDLLLGGTPRLNDLRSPEEPNFDGMSWFDKQILCLMSRERNAEFLPILLDDIQKRMLGWGQEGRVEPFKVLAEIAFQLTIRVSTCRELADDVEATTQFQQDFSALEKTSSPVTLLLPWLPTRARKNEQMANEKLRATVRTYVEKRKAATTPSPDAIDVLLSRGLTGERIIDCLLNVVWVSVFNTSVNSSWILVHLASHPEWKQKVAVEVDALIKKYASDSTEPIHKVLASIPSSAWDEEMPMLDLVIRETLRLTVEGSMPRRNLSNDLEILGKRVSKGSFVIYRAGDAHMNPDIYTNPTEFDPNRFAPGREEDKKEPYAFLGWGAGRHPCPGMKFAKLQLRIVVSLFLSAYQYELVNENGGPLEEIPKPNYNELHGTRPREQVYFKFKRVRD